MLSVLINIISFIGTFTVISSLVILIVQGAVCLVHKDWRWREKTDTRIILIGILTALFLIPYYYFPA